VRYLLAIFLPPVAMLSVGKPFQAILCLILMITLIGWPIAAIWAILVVNSSFADARNKELIAEMQRQTEVQVAAAQAAQAQAQAQIAQAQAQAQVAQAQSQAQVAQAHAQTQVAEAQAQTATEQPANPPTDPA
jgi:multidrug efflux pump subunit AcrA (membrane-fusion protein)